MSRSRVSTGWLCALRLNRARPVSGGSSSRSNSSSLSDQSFDRVGRRCYAQPQLSCTAPVAESNGFQQGAAVRQLSAQHTRPQQRPASPTASPSAYCKTCQLGVKSQSGPATRSPTAAEESIHLECSSKFLGAQDISHTSSNYQCLLCKHKLTTPSSAAGHAEQSHSSTCDSSTARVPLHLCPSPHKLSSPPGPLSPLKQLQQFIPALCLPGITALQREGLLAESGAFTHGAGDPYGPGCPPAQHALPLTMLESQCSPKRLAVPSATFANTPARCQSQASPEGGRSVWASQVSHHKAAVVSPVTNAQRPRLLQPSQPDSVTSLSSGCRPGAAALGCLPAALDPLAAALGPPAAALGPPAAALCPLPAAYILSVASCQLPAPELLASPKLMHAATPPLAKLHSALQMKAEPPAMQAAAESLIPVGHLSSLDGLASLPGVASPESMPGEMPGPAHLHCDSPPECQMQSDADTDIIGELLAGLAIDPTEAGASFVPPCSTAVAALHTANTGLGAEPLQQPNLANSPAGFVAPCHLPLSSASASDAPHPLQQPRVDKSPAMAGPDPSLSGSTAAAAPGWANAASDIAVPACHGLWRDAAACNEAANHIAGVDAQAEIAIIVPHDHVQVLAEGCGGAQAAAHCSISADRATVLTRADCIPAQHRQTVTSSPVGHRSHSQLACPTLHLDAVSNPSPVISSGSSMTPSRLVESQEHVPFSHVQTQTHQEDSVFPERTSSVQSGCCSNTAQSSFDMFSSDMLARQQRWLADRRRLELSEVIVQSEQSGCDCTDSEGSVSSENNLRPSSVCRCRQSCPQHCKLHQL